MKLLIHGKSYDLIDLVSDLIASRKRLELFDSDLYKILKSSNLAKSLIGNTYVL